MFGKLFIGIYLTECESDLEIFRNVVHKFHIGGDKND